MAAKYFIVCAQVQRDFYPNCMCIGLFMDSHYKLEKDVEDGGGVCGCKREKSRLFSEEPIKRTRVNGHKSLMRKFHFAKQRKSP